MVTETENTPPFYYKKSDGTVDTGCTTSLIQTPIVIPSTGVKRCSLLCAVEFTYPSTGWSIKFENVTSLNHYQFQVTNTSNAPHLKYNGGSYKLRKIELYAKSLHRTMENNNTPTQYDAELCMWHQSNNGLKWVVVSVFLNQSQSYSVSQEFFREFLYPIPTDLTNSGANVDITLSESWSPYQALPYKKSFYIYSGSAPYSPCNVPVSATDSRTMSELAWIVFDNTISIDGRGEYIKLLNWAKNFTGNDGSKFDTHELGTRPIYYNDGSFVPGNMDSTNKVYVKCMKKADKNSQLALKQSDILDNTVDGDPYNHYGMYATTYKKEDYSDSSSILLLIIFCLFLILIVTSRMSFIYFVTMVVIFLILFFYTFLGSPRSMALKYSAILGMYVSGVIVSICREFVASRDFNELSTGGQFKYAFAIIIGVLLFFHILFLAITVLFANNYDTNEMNGLSNAVRMSSPLSTILTITKTFYKVKTFSEFDANAPDVEMEASLFASETFIAEKSLINVMILSHSFLFGSTSVSLNAYINNNDVRQLLAYEYDKEMKNGNNTPRGCWLVAVNRVIKDEELFDQDEREYLRNYQDAKNYDPKKYGNNDFMGVYNKLSM